MRLAVAILAVAGGAALAPLRVFGHGGEFMLAKLVLAKSGEVQLELTADYGDNPMLHGEDDAEEALRHCLRVRLNDKPHELGELGVLYFEKRTQFDSDAPLPKDPVNDSKPHQLLTATWQWRPNAESIAFDVPNGNPHNVVLWKASEGVKPEQRWLFMIAGDFTPPIPIPKTTAPPTSYLGLLGVVIAGIAAPIAWLRKRRAALA